MRLSTMFKRYLVSYFIVLLLPCAAGYFLYATSIDVAEKKSVENSLLFLNQSKQMIDVRLTELDALSKQLSMDRDMLLLMDEQTNNPEIEEDRTYEMWNVSKELAQYRRTNDFLDRFFVFLHNHQVVLEPNHAFFRPRDFYAIQYGSEQGYLQWEQWLRRSHEFDFLPLSHLTGDTRQEEAVSLTQSLPFDHMGNPKGTLVITIEKSKIGQYLDDFVTQYEGDALVVHPNGQVIYQNGSSFAAKLADSAALPSGLAGDRSRIYQDHLLLAVRSELTNWQYIASIPLRSIQQEASIIRTTTIVYMSAALLLGLGFIALFAYRNSRPISRLLALVQEHPVADRQVGRDDFEFLSANIQQLVERNARLRTDLQEQWPLVRDGYIKRLLVGNLQSLAEFEAISGQLGLDASAAGVAALVHLKGYAELEEGEAVNELEVGRLLVRQELQAEAQQPAITDWEPDKVAVILQMKASDHPSEWKKELEKRLESLSQRLHDKYGMSIAVGCGTNFRALNEASQSLGEALEALEFGSAVRPYAPIWYEEGAKKNELYYYPLELEQRLFKSLQTGYLDESKRILHYIMQRNFNQSALSDEMKRQLLEELRTTLRRLLDRYREKDGEKEKLAAIEMALATIHHGMPAAQLQQELDRLVTDICSLVLLQKDAEKDELVQCIVQQLECEYHDPDFTLFRLTEHVKKTEKYMSSLFKKQTGETITEYLERLRIDKATELLLEGQATIDEIAGLTGYNSAHSFRRAFKRVKGVSPSVFRDEGRSGE
ncbi:helix-turn-helix domain-containing protein [Paenibacillus sp. IB182496]|uniref:Helix-turn-helix domain-containing protein n=1 Tax=Paenibacillus sabuli TaxID=2772509 RepID=A0A927BWF5_9BACL|nr:helix-turn-helix domain-containing protein [Paenibacillus sabuli]MBD2848128.1 helix-turn-helix domain-containing protein [Paenibacillus sabuli]